MNEEALIRAKAIQQRLMQNVNIENDCDLNLLRLYVSLTDSALLEIINVVNISGLCTNIWVLS